MGIADFFRPKHRHSDVRVRTEAVKALGADETDILITIAKTDHDIGVRRLAISKLSQPEVLAELLQAESERSLREYLESRAGELWTTRACGEDAEAANAALSGIAKLGDQRALVEVVVRAAVPAIRKRAFGELRDPRALAELAKRDAPQELRTAAVARIDDGDVLRALAIDTSTKEVGLAAVEKIDDVDRLEHVAQKAKHKAVRQKARKIVAEIAEAQKTATAAKSVVPDDVKRKRAERAQLVREVEGIADTFDFTTAAGTVTTAESAWAALGGNEAGDDRFQKAVTRFWRRKELNDQTARSADELRSVEREAQRDRERERERATAAAAAESATAAPVAAEPESDEQRAAREAEAEARRAEHEVRRAEEEARRAAQVEERAARAKEDAERGTAIAASLVALCEEMEALAEAKESKGIDKLLTSSAKAFEGIGKVPADQRDVIADRYRVARGKLVTRAGDLREAEDWQRWANVPKAEALITTAKEWQLEEPSTDLGNRLRSLQALWKEIGPLPQRRSQELWDTFKVECDKVYEHVRGVRAVEQEQFAAVTAVKEALIAEAEALGESTDWVATSDKLKALQTQWKGSGHLPRKLGDELWKRFRAACDKFFERRKPLLDAQFEEQAHNLAAKQQLIERAQTIAHTAPGVGGWGKAIGEIKDLQAEWKDIGFVPRKDADAVYQAFRAACDALFTKRDQSRDSEANAHRAAQDQVAADIDAVMAGGDDVVARAISVRAKATELGVHTDKVQAMLRHLVTTQPAAIAGTELDPTQLRAKREQLIARAEEVLPKAADAIDAAAQPKDLASRLKQAMSKNAFGSLRWSGRDPVEVVAELRAEWAEGGPILDDADRTQHERFEQVVKRVLDTAGIDERTEREAREAREGRGVNEVRDPNGDGRRRRRERSMPESGTQQPVAGLPSSNEPAALADVVATAAAIPQASSVMAIPDAAGSAVAEIGAPERSTVEVAPISAHDAVTRPVHMPPEISIGRDTLAATPTRAKTPTSVPLEEIDGGWDDDEADPTAGAESEHANAPSSAEMAGDGSVEGDGLDQVD